ncbi:MAG: glycerol-3-phosphate acyltransferase, partial [Pseudomonadota bacterium]
AKGFLKIQSGMLLLVSHVTLLTYAEAYSVVADLLALTHDEESLTEQHCINKALKLGQQAYLQRRISSPASIGKLVFKNGFRLAQHRKLATGGSPEIGQDRKAFAAEVRDVLRRIELIRALGVSIRNSTGESS